MTLKKKTEPGEESGTGSDDTLAGDETLLGDKGVSMPGERRPLRRFDRGESVGRYVVLDVLGEGAMGVVYAAYDPELDRKVALKLLKVERASGPDAMGGRARLLREAQAIAKLSHPNVVSIFDVGVVEAEQTEQVYLAMEYVEGRTLTQLFHDLHRQPDWESGGGWREALQSMVSAGRGLAAAHAAGIIHRDFKPDNVLVGNDGRVRVLDFGLARQDADAGSEHLPGADELLRSISRSRSKPGVEATQAGALVGTPAYMAAELFDGKAADAHTDQFAMCVSLYEGLFGRRPFRGDKLATIAFQVTQGAVQDAPGRPHVPLRIRRAILKGLSVAPSERHASVDALLEELTRDPTAKLRRWAAFAGIVTVAMGFVYAGYALTRPGHVTVAVTLGTETLEGVEVLVGDQRLEPDENGASGDVAAGLYRVLVRAPGFLEHEELLAVGRGAQHEISIALVHQQGSFDLTVEPAGATIIVDEVDYGSRLRGVPFDTGEHEILLTKIGHYERDLEWSARQDQTEHGFFYLPKAVIWSATATGVNHDLLWAGDITGDGREEVFHKNFSTLTAYDPWEDERVWSFKIGDNIDQILAFADLDVDGALDVVVVRRVVGERGLGAWSSMPTGKKPTELWSRWESPRGTAPTALAIARPVILDVDGDGDLDVISTSGWEGVVAAYEGRRGTVLWSQSIDDFGIALAAAGGTEAAVYVVTADRAMALNLQDGNRRWEVELPRLPEGEDGARTLIKMQSRTIAGHTWLEATDLDGVGPPDVIIPMDGRGEGGLLALAGSDGSVLWKADAEAIQWNSRGSNLIDVTGDGVQDVVVGFGGKTTGVGVLNGSDGEVLWQHEGGSAAVRRRRPGDPPVLLVSRKDGVNIVDPGTGEVTASLDLEGYGGVGGTMFSDWDGDGEAELVVPQGERRIGIFAESGQKEGSLSLPVGARKIIPSGDMNGDGVDDLLIEAAGPTVIVGPKVLWSRTVGDAVRATPVLEDLDGDGDLELAAFGVWGKGEVLHIYDAGTGELQAAGENQSGVIRGAVAIPAEGEGHDLLAQSFRGGQLQLYSGRDASILKTHEVGPTYGIPGYGDVDGDGQMEIVAVPWEDDLLRVLDAKTWELEWTVPLEMGGWVEPRIANVDGRGAPEILMGFNDGMFRVLDGTSGAELWSKSLGPLKVDHSATVGDFEADGEFEAVISTADDAHDILILSAATGIEKRRLEGMGGPLPVILLDIDEDDRPEMLVPSHAHGILCLRANGDELWRFDVTPEGDEPIGASAPMTLTDLEDDGRYELLATLGDGSLRVLDARTGELRWSFHTGHPTIEAAVVAGDVDGDGNKEVFLGSYDRHLYALRGGR